MKDIVDKIKSGYFLSKCRIDKNTNCHIWTGWKTGYPPHCYGRIRYNKRTRRLHRVIFEFYNGPISEKMEVCHSCDNGLCINPEHLWLGTQNDNMQDMKNKQRANRPKGESNPSHKLDWKDIEEIRAETEHMSHLEIAKKFNINRATISNIANNKYWIDKNYKPRQKRIRKLTQQQANEIREMYKQKIRPAEIKKRYNIKGSTYYQIIRNQTYKNI